MGSTLPSKKTTRKAKSKRARAVPNGVAGSGTSQVSQQARQDWPTIECGAAGDHPSVQAFLTSLFHRPSSAEFQAQVDEPQYEPSDRLLLKRGSRLVAHLRISKREMRFGDLALPTAEIRDVATLPEFRRQGCASALLQAADQQMREDGAALGVLNTSDPHFYAKRGWVVFGNQSYSEAGARDVLSQLSALRELRPTTFFTKVSQQPDTQLNIRLWRHVEEAALIRLYAENTGHLFGPLERSPAYWRWLISRRGYDRIYVAIKGPDKLPLDDKLTAIVGYAATKGGRIAELVTTPDHPEAAEHLLARACSEAIELDEYPVRFDAPPNHPLHQVFVDAGGQHHTGLIDQGEVQMAKLFDPMSFLNHLCPQIHGRAKASSLELPTELGIQVDDQRYRIVFNQQRITVVPGRLGRSYLTCGSGPFAQLLLGHLNVQEAIKAGKLAASTRIAVETANSLFPKLQHWFPSLDNFTA